VLNSIEVQKELIQGANKENCGYLIDAYHATRSGSGPHFESLPAEKIFCFQYSDVPPAPVDEGVRRPTDRLAPGKGIVDWPAMLDLLKAKGYTGYLSYEAPNPELWARPPLDVAHEGVELTRKLLAEVR
jgi:sugar phosphate isomerase/epimerase